MTYDAESRLATVTNGGSVVSYDYDGEGRRVRKTVAAGQTVYVYDAAGQLTAEYSTVSNPDSGTRYLTADHLGSTRVVTDALQAVKQRLDYFPFGQALASLQQEGNRNLVTGYAATSGLTQEFTGKERDNETGLDWFETRYLSSAQGRFTRLDPLPWLHWQRARDEDRAEFQGFISDPQNLNLYAHTRNNPLRFTDPTGMYYCSGTTQLCARLKKAYEQAQAAAKSQDLTDKQRGAIQQVLEFLGPPGRANGVVVEFAATDAGTTSNTDVEKPFGKLITTITLNPTKFSAFDTESEAETFIHEGSYGVDDAARGRNPETWVEELTTERNAYRVQSFVSQGSGVASRWGLWDPTLSSPQSEISRQKAIETNA